MSKKRLKLSKNLQKFRKARKLPTEISKICQNTDQNVEKQSSPSKNR